MLLYVVIMLLDLGTTLGPKYFSLPLVLVCCKNVDQWPAWVECQMLKLINLFFLVADKGVFDVFRGS